MNKTKTISLIIAICLFTTLIGCNKKEEEPVKKSFTALDTYITLTIYGEDADKAAKAIQNSIGNYEKTFSVTEPISDIYLLNTEKSADVCSDTMQLINRSTELSQLTNGLFDISVYSAVKAWGFTTGNYIIPGSAELSKLAEAIDYTAIKTSGSTVTIPDSMLLDLGGCAKGYIGDKLAAQLKLHNVTGAVLSLGGNIITYGSKADGKDWCTGIEYPGGSDYYATLISGSTNIISSGAYQRNFTGDDGNIYHHIIDPRTAAPAKSDLKEVTIICTDGTKADCLSTALYVMGLEDAKKFCKNNSGFDAVILAEDDSVYITSGIKDSFELSESHEDMVVKVIE